MVKMYEIWNEILTLTVDLVSKYCVNLLTETKVLRNKPYPNLFISRNLTP